MPDSTEISVPGGCDNSPRKAIVRDVLVSIARGDNDPILERVSPDVEWITHGVERGRREDVAALAVETILSHGKHCSANGRFTTRDGSQHAFADVFEFSSHAKTASIVRVTSHVVPLD